MDIAAGMFWARAGDFPLWLRWVSCSRYQVGFEEPLTYRMYSELVKRENAKKACLRASLKQKVIQMSETDTCNQINIINNNSTLTGASLFS